MAYNTKNTDRNPRVYIAHNPATGDVHTGTWEHGDKPRLYTKAGASAACNRLNRRSTQRRWNSAYGRYETVTSLEPTSKYVVQEVTLTFAVDPLEAKIKEYLRKHGNAGTDDQVLDVVTKDLLNIIKQA